MLAKGCCVQHTEKKLFLVYSARLATQVLPVCASSVAVNLIENRTVSYMSA